MLEEKPVSLFLTVAAVRQKWQQLLSANGIERLAPNDYRKLDECFGLYHGDELIATAAFSGKIIKFVAISPAYRNSGATFNLLLSTVVQAMAARGRFHAMVVTKPMYQKSFQYIGFRVVAATSEGVMLETGDTSIHDYLITQPKRKGRTIASIVMNANPFTRGHYELVKTAASENDVVYVFVLSQEQGLFSTEERMQLVSQGVAEFHNVVVCPGSDYIISPATFPTYFLRKTASETAFQTELDAVLFKTQIAPYFQINRRYLGEEPLSRITEIYNQTLEQVLEPEIKVRIIPRKTTRDGDIISASRVRRAYLNNELDKVQEYIPKTTLQFLENKSKTSKLLGVH